MVYHAYAKNPESSENDGLYYISGCEQVETHGHPHDMAPDKRDERSDRGRQAPQDGGRHTDGNIPYSPQYPLRQGYGHAAVNGRNDHVLCLLRQALFVPLRKRQVIKNVATYVLRP